MNGKDVFEELKSLPPQRRVRMVFSAQVKKQGAALLHQQCGLWGWDIRREVDGIRKNLLIEMGFERTPPPAGILGATTYSKREIDKSIEVILWGFGLYFGDQNGGIFLSRFKFYPRYSPLKINDHVWLPQPLQAQFQCPSTAHECLSAFRYFVGAMQWMADYEAEVVEKLGTDYRSNTLHSWEMAGRGHQRFGQREEAEGEHTKLPEVKNWTEMASLTLKEASFRYRSKGKTRQSTWPQFR